MGAAPHLVLLGVILLLLASLSDVIAVNAQQKMMQQEKGEAVVEFVEYVVFFVGLVDLLGFVVVDS